MGKSAVGMVLVCAAAIVALGGCFAEDGPSTKELPPTDELSTEKSVTTTTTSRSTTTAARSGAQTIGEAISIAPRVDNTDYHEAAPAEGEPVEDTSEFHFSTADGQVRCSTVDRDTATLACDAAGGATQPEPDSTPAGCTWHGSYVVLAESSRQGSCTDTPWVWVRSEPLLSGSTISIGRFQCLAVPTGLYCLNTRSDNGFAIRDGAYRVISGADPAPAALTEIPAPGAPATTTG
ncbi:hypothetical protein [Williamsia sp.]|uniref:hypothetical protein n=1 Tax=Williamsia sp. TaxID=1872085 RepID=UPI002F934621